MSKPTRDKERLIDEKTHIVKRLLHAAPTKTAAVLKSLPRVKK
jgi:hypothetical protein